MSRVIKAPNVREVRPMSVVDREQVLRYVEDEAQQIREQAESDAQELLERAQSEIEEVIAQAQAQAEEIIAEAREQAEVICEAGKEEGIRQGDNAGRQQVRQEVSGLMADLAQMLDQGRHTLESMIVDQEREIRRLVAQIATKVVLNLVNEDHETVHRVARESIRLASDRQALTLLIHPEDREVIELHCPEYRVAFDDLEKIELREDPRVPRGSVIVETPSGGVDGRIPKQLAIIKETLLPEEDQQAAIEEAEDQWSPEEEQIPEEEQPEALEDQELPVEDQWSSEEEQTTEENQPEAFEDQELPVEDQWSPEEEEQIPEEDQPEAFEDQELPVEDQWSPEEEQIPEEDQPEALEDQELPIEDQWSPEEEQIPEEDQPEAFADQELPMEDQQFPEPNEEFSGEEDQETPEAP
ncbi:MAG: FliH/SctL family protein [bacterium]